MLTINQLWLVASKGKFGFSVQKQIWLEVGGKPGQYDSNIFWRFQEEVEWAENEIVFDQRAAKGHLPVGVFVKVSDDLRKNQKWWVEIDKIVKTTEEERDKLEEERDKLLRRKIINANKWSDKVALKSSNRGKISRISWVISSVGVGIVFLVAVLEGSAVLGVVAVVSAVVRYLVLLGVVVGQCAVVWYWIKIRILRLGSRWGGVANEREKRWEFAKERWEGIEDTEDLDLGYFSLLSREDL